MNSSVEYISGEKNMKIVKEEKFVASHIDTPEAVKAIYMTSWVAGNPSFREKLVKIADETEVNSIIIDIKDYTGRIAFKVEDEMLQEVGAVENRIPDVREFIKLLHDKGIYVMGRISVFQDPYYVSKYPEFAVIRESDGEVWGDYKGISWLDAGSKQVWDYTVAIAKKHTRMVLMSLILIILDSHQMEI